MIIEFKLMIGIMSDDETKVNAMLKDEKFLQTLFEPLIRRLPKDTAVYGVTVLDSKIREDLKRDKRKSKSGRRKEDKI